MIRSLTLRDLEQRYVGSALGFFWFLIHPLMQIVIYYFVFSVVLRVKLGPEYAGTHFAVWLIAGLIPWLFFSEVVGRSSGAVLEQAHVIKKSRFPSEVLSIVHVLAAGVGHLIILGLFFMLLLLTPDKFSPRYFLFIIYFFMTAVFALGLSWWISSVNVYLRDFGPLIAVLLQIWFFLTPIIYPENLIPEQYLKYLYLNPMLHVTAAYRTLFLSDALPPLSGFICISAWALFFIVTGGMIFRRLKSGFAEVL